MTARVPDPSEESKQDKVVQACPELRNHATDAPVESVPKNTSALAAKPEEAADPEAELDRVEIYLRGPTAFSA